VDPPELIIASSTSKSFIIPKLAHKLSHLEEPDISYAVVKDRTVQAPPSYSYLPYGHVLTDKEEEQLDDQEKHWDDYNQQEAMIMAQILTTILDNVLIEIQNLAMVKEVWEAVCMKHETKALTIQVDMGCRMYKMKCKDESNIHTHLETLMRMHEQLGMSTALTDDDLVTIILASLPKSYHLLINAIMMSAAHTKAKLEPDQVIRILNKFMQLTIKECQLKASKNALTAA
jgi:gag-polypeptide of LTR copia-type